MCSGDGEAHQYYTSTIKLGAGNGTESLEQEHTTPEIVATTAVDRSCSLGHVKEVVPSQRMPKLAGQGFPRPDRPSRNPADPHAVRTGRLTYVHRRLGLYVQYVNVC